MRGTVASAVAVVLVLGAPAARAEEKLVYALEIAGSARPDAWVVQRGDDLLVRERDLTGAGIDVSRAARETIDGEPFISLRSFGEQLRFEIDEKTVLLRLAPAPELLPAQQIDLTPAHRTPVRRETSAFANYSVRLDSQAGASGVGEAGVSAMGALLTSTAQINPGGSAARGLTTLSYDRAEQTQRLSAGDVFASAGGLGGAAVLGGVSIAREFSLDPTATTGVLPQAIGAASTPSILDVYVNGVLVREQTVAAGAYQLTNIPAVTGGGEVRTVLRDAFGRTTEMRSPYYFSPGLLAPGTSDFQVAAGFVRAVSLASDYGAPALISRYRRGFSNSLTLGGRFEWSGATANAGATLDLGLRHGELSLETAASRSNGTPGEAASLTYSILGSVVSGSAQLRVQSRAYATTSLRAQDDRPLAQLDLAASASLSNWLSSGLTLSMERERDAGGSGQGTARFGVDLHRAGTISLDLGATRAAHQGLQPYAALTFTRLFGKSDTAYASATSGSGSSSASAGVQRSLPFGSGFGYRVQAQSGTAPGSTSANVVLLGQSETGRYEAGATGGSNNEAYANVSGGIALIGGVVKLTRPIEDGFALVQIPQVPNAPVFLDEQEVGRTDARGDLIVPGLIAYSPRRIRVGASEISLDVSLGALEQTVASPWRTGVRVQFAAQSLRTATGELRIDSGGVERVPAYGELLLNLPEGELRSPLGGSGRFELEGVRAGRFPAVVRWAGKSCVLFVQIAEGAGSLELGTLVCRHANPILQLAAQTPAPTAPDASSAIATRESLMGATPRAAAVTSTQELVLGDALAHRRSRRKKPSANVAAQQEHPAQAVAELAPTATTGAPDAMQSGTQNFETTELARLDLYVSGRRESDLLAELIEQAALS